MSRCAIVALVSIASHGHAQKKFVGITGDVLRYNGDTIWIEHDTTLTRTIYRGDTTIVTRFVNDRLINESLFVIRDDSAYLVRTRDSLGVEHQPAAERGLPLSVLTMARQSLERELQVSNTRRLLSRTGMPSPWDDISTATAAPITYTVSSDLRLVQSHDTVWNIHGCPGAARADTTVFRLYGRDSVERVSAPRRMFGEAMAGSLVSKMQMALVRRDLAQRQPALPLDLPRAPDPCRVP